MRRHSLILGGLFGLIGFWTQGSAATGEAVAGYGLRAEWAGPCRKSDPVDVNQGNAPEVFVRAAACQISGRMPEAATIQTWSQGLVLDDRVRRIDVVESLCRAAHRVCRLSYSNPWRVEPSAVTPPCDKRYRRDIGAVVMFFFHCPHRVNCSLDWANNHVRGMKARDRDLGWGDQAAGYYVASNPGFWRHELRDARSAGLQYILPNLYGPDMTDEGEIDTLAAALAQEADPVKVGLFDDSWAWGHRQFGKPWSHAPDLSHTQAAADILYTAKWRPYFRKIAAANWYRIDNRPVIYFYNAGTLKPARQAAAVLREMKRRFAADFGVTPYVVVDDAFFADPDMVNVADSRFRWDTLGGDFQASDGTVTVADRLGRSPMGGKSLTNAFVRWDSSGRDQSATFADRVIKGPDLLQHVLDKTHDDDSLLIATWNDLGEGTGVNASYDYYVHGQWLRPDAFMQTIRRDNCRN